MIKIAMQVNKYYGLDPFSGESKDLIKNYHVNQIVKVKISGVRKERSVIQSNMLHACIKTVAENTNDPQWDHPEKVKIQLKHLLHFYKSTIVLPDGSIHFELDSFAFANLGQVEANKIFDRAWPILAKKIGITVDELLKNSEG